MDRRPVYDPRGAGLEGGDLGLCGLDPGLELGRLLPLPGDLVEQPSDLPDEILESAGTGC
jgi:hypothetical protein